MASWPTSIPTDATLYIAVNELQTNLSTGVNTIVTTLTLNSTTSFPTVGLVLIDNEIIKYTGVSGSDLTGCTRAFDGTTAAAHSAGAIVSFAICANHHNVTKDEIIALATYLSNNLGTGAQPLSNGSRALASNGSGKIIESSVTSTELSYLSGVSSAIQTQLNTLTTNVSAKAPSASPTFTGTVTTPVAANFALETGTSGVLEASTTTKTELGYVHGVTSAIQTQINGKEPTVTQLPISKGGTNSVAALSNSRAMVSSSGAVVEGAATVNAAGYIIGSVVQAIQATNTGSTSSSGTSYTSTGTTVSITPKATTHKIKITVTGVLQNAQLVTNQSQASIFRGSTDLDATGQGFTQFNTNSGSGVFNVPASMCFLDSPASTSALTYTVKILSTVSAKAVWNPNTATAVIIVEEIALY